MNHLPFKQTGKLPRHLGTFDAAKYRPQVKDEKRDYWGLAVVVMTVAMFAVTFNL